MDVSLRLDVTKSDAYKIIDWLEDKSVTKYLNEDVDTGYKLCHIIDEGNANLLTYYLNQDGRFFLIDNTKECIGFINLFTVVPQQEYEVVIAIGDPANWGQNYAKKALKKIMFETFIKWRIHRLTAKIKIQNTRSLLLFEHLNFQKVKANEDTVFFSLDVYQYLANAK